jgi:hypothetical protein
MLRCLIDRDGDGVYESFSRIGRLVPIPTRRPRILPAAEPEPPAEIMPLAAPVTLVRRDGIPNPNQEFEPRTLTRITVRRARDAELELRLEDGVVRGPERMVELFSEAAADEVTVPLSDVAETTIQGIRFRFVRAGSGWTATVLDGAAAEPKLHCSGAVVETGDTFTVLHPGGQSMYPRSSLPAQP